MPRSSIRGQTAETRWQPQRESLRRGGTFVWKVQSDDGVLGPQSATLTFRVAKQQLEETWASARAAIDAGGDAEVRTVLAAHLAIRLRLFIEARRIATSFLAQHPDAELVDKTRRYVDRRIGFSDD